MSDSIRLRPATRSDAAALLAIYAPFVEKTAISFEVVPPTAEELSARIDRSLAGWQWLIAECEEEMVGYAYGSAHRERPAYRWGVEVTAYVRPSHHRRGIGGLLYRKLLADLAQKGYCNAYAGVTLPNHPSVALHRSAGFQPIGTFERVGRKFGKWHDVAWFQRRLQESPPYE